MTVAAGATQNLFTSTGADGYIDLILLAFDGSDETNSMNGVINIYYDGESSPTVSCPCVNMFMATYMNGTNTGFSSVFAGANSNTTATGGISMHFRLPIPFTNSIKVDFVNGSSTSSCRLFSTVKAQIGVPNTWPRTRKLYVFPYYNAGVAPYALVTLVNATALNPGRFMGLWMLFDDYPNTVSPQQAELEGDLSITLDGAASPQYVSSGTEDHFLLGYYGAGIPTCWGQNGEIGTTFRSGTVTTSFYRWHLRDPITFQNALAIIWPCGDSTEVAFTGDPRVWATVFYYTE